MKIKPIVLAILSALSLHTAIAQTQFDPRKKPVTVIMPFAPGGGVDQTFRHLQKYASQKGITLVGVYKPGADGLVSMSELAIEPRDGYYISVTTAGVIANYRLHHPSSDVTAITTLRDSVMALVVSNKSEIQDINQLERYLQQGKKLNLGYGAPGQQMFLEQLFELAKAKAGSVMVPYKGGGPVVNDLLGGHIDVAAVPLSIVKSHIDSGKVKLVGLASRAKFEGYSTVPLMKNKYPKWEEFDGFAVVVEKNTNTEAVTWWSNFLHEYVNDENVKKDFVQEFTVPTEFGTKTLENTIKSSIKRLEKNGH